MIIAHLSWSPSVPSRMCPKIRKGAVKQLMTEAGEVVMLNMGEEEEKGEATEADSSREGGKTNFLPITVRLQRYSI